ncbi:hypothetical protein K1T71_000607 [Dendrolimus kikuchii]|uniref:Uncharacterized protein n=1 Tax=Dendrolimus kikuchii TaxID=765133 RepID=A0ACC1DJP0_9NEOP|nr:hypothetical protein K1T71_000607 [Dendrolimus kikuchii]
MSFSVLLQTTLEISLSSQAQANFRKWSSLKPKGKQNECNQAKQHTACNYHNSDNFRNWSPETPAVAKKNLPAQSCFYKNNESNQANQQTISSYHNSDNSRTNQQTASSYHNSDNFRKWGTFKPEVKQNLPAQANFYKDEDKILETIYNNDESNQANQQTASSYYNSDNSRNWGPLNPATAKQTLPAQSSFDEYDDIISKPIFNTDESNQANQQTASSYHNSDNTQNRRISNPSFAKPKMPVDFKFDKDGVTISKTTFKNEESNERSEDASSSINSTVNDNNSTKAYSNTKRNKTSKQTYKEKDTESFTFARDGFMMNEEVSRSGDKKETDDEEVNQGYEQTVQTNNTSHSVSSTAQIKKHKEKEDLYDEESSKSFGFGSNGLSNKNKYSKKIQNSTLSEESGKTSHDEKESSSKDGFQQSSSRSEKGEYSKSEKLSSNRESTEKPSKGDHN